MLENGHIPYYLLTAIPLQQAAYLYRKKKEKREEMVSHLKSSINSNDYLLHSAPSFTEAGCVMRGYSSAHAQDAAPVSAARHSQPFYWVFISPVLKGKSKKRLAKQATTVGLAVRRIICFTYSPFNLLV